MPELFNVHGFGPPHPFTGTSTWPWVDHLVSGLPPTTFRPIQTRFRYGYAPKVLNQAAEGNSPVHYAKGTRSPFPDKSGIGLPPLVSTWFQVLLTPLAGVLFTFQSPYLFTIGCRVVLSLGGWTPQLHTEFHELRATLESRS